MKKFKILATCFAAASVGAQAKSSVQLNGLVDAYVGSMRMAGDASSKTVVGSGGMTTSWWGMSGTEDLGQGMKASFALTSFFQTDTGATGRFADPQFSRDANVSLSNTLGTLTFGRGKAPNFLPTILFNPMGDSYTFSPLVLHSSVPVGLFGAYRWTGTVPADTGWSNQITYSSPTFAGLKGNLHYQLGEQGTGVNESAHNVGFNLFYSAGPVGLTAYWERDEINNPFPPNAVLATGTQTAWMLGGTYDAGVVKLFATTGKSSNVASTIAKQTTSLGVSAPLGGGKFVAAVAHTKNDVATTSRTTSTVGYDYNLSKRTDLYTMLMNDKITNFDSGTSLGFGVRHRF